MRTSMLAVGSMCLLGACNLWADADLFTSDLIAVLDDGEPLTTPLELAFEISGPSQCQEVTDGLLPPLNAAYSQVESLGCSQRGFNTVATFRVAAEIVHEIANQKSDSDQPIYLGVYEDTPDVLTVGFFRNEDAINTFAGAVPENLTLYGGTEVSPIMSATLQNDLRDPVSLRLVDVFADGAAIPSYDKKLFELGRRAEVQVELSDVANAALTGSYAYVVIADVLLPNRGDGGSN